MEELIKQTEESPDAGFWYNCMTPLINGIWAISNSENMDTPHLTDSTPSRMVRDEFEKIATQKVTEKTLITKALESTKAKAPLLRQLKQNRVYFLTPEQVCVWSCKEPFVTITGTAGTGKTLLLWGKLVECCCNNRNLRCVALVTTPMIIKVSTSQQALYARWL